MCIKLRTCYSATVKLKLKQKQKKSLVICTAEQKDES